jgi:hypothetical protein
VSRSGSPGALSLHATGNVSTYPNELAPAILYTQNKWHSPVFCSYSGDQDKYVGGARAIGLDVPANERSPLPPPHLIC